MTGRGLRPSPVPPTGDPADEAVIFKREWIPLMSRLTYQEVGHLFSIIIKAFIRGSDNPAYEEEAVNEMDRRAGRPPRYKEVLETWYRIDRLIQEDRRKRYGMQLVDCPQGTVSPWDGEAAS